MAMTEINGTNARDNNEQIIFKLLYKVTNQQEGGTSFDIMLLINTETKEILGMGKIHQNSDNNDILTNLSGKWSANTHETGGISISAFGSTISKNLLYRPSKTQRNVELQISLNDDWRIGIANFKYMKDQSWVNGGYTQAQLISELDLAALTQEMAKHQNKIEAVLH